MRKITESDIFDSYINKGNSTTGKITKILAGMSREVVILNELLSPYIATMVRFYKEPSTIRISNAIKEGKIILFKTPVELNLPRCLPFIRYKKGGDPTVAVDLTSYITEIKDKDNDSVEYHIDVTKLYALTFPAFISLELLDDDTILSNDALYSASVLWAKLFNKVLVRAIGLATNKDRYTAFIYFAMRFFLKYYMETPDAIIDSITTKYLGRDKENYVIEFMTNQINHLGLQDIMYSSFTEFCTVLFNNEVSNVRGTKVNNVAESVNTHFYVSQFINLYKFESLLSLSSFQYFLFTLVSADKHARICNDAAILDILKDEKKLLPSLLTSLYKEIR